MHYIRKNKILIAGLIIGAIAGFCYWKFVGCISGTCAITSNPYYSSIYGAVSGALLLSLFQKNKTETE